MSPVRNTNRRAPNMIPTFPIQNLTSFRNATSLFLVVSLLAVSLPLNLLPRRKGPNSVSRTARSSPILPEEVEVWPPPPSLLGREVLPFCAVSLVSVLWEVWGLSGPFALWGVSVASGRPSSQEAALFVASGEAAGPLEGRRVRSSQ